MRSFYICGGVLFFCSILLFFWPVDASSIANEKLEPVAAHDLETANRATPLVEFRVVAERPLFSKNRQPPNNPGPILKATTNEDQPNPEDFDPVVQGVLLSAGLPKALIMMPDLSEPQWVEKGSVLKGWTLVEVEKSHVTFVEGPNTIDVFLFSEDN